MKVFDYLDAIDDIIESASGFPLTGKIMIDADELREILQQIRSELPDEFEQARWVKQEQNRILDEAKTEYESVINDARRQAEVLVEEHDITVKAKVRAERIVSLAEEQARNLKLNTYEYMDSIMENLQMKIEEMNASYFVDMFNNLENTFNGINDTLTSNRNEIENMAYELAPHQVEDVEPTSGYIDEE